MINIIQKKREVLALLFALVHIVCALPAMNSVTWHPFSNDTSSATISSIVYETSSVILLTNGYNAFETTKADPNNRRIIVDDEKEWQKETALGMYNSSNATTTASGDYISTSTMTNLKSIWSGTPTTSTDDNSTLANATAISFTGVIPETKFVNFSKPIPTPIPTVNNPKKFIPLQYNNGNSSLSLNDSMRLGNGSLTNSSLPASVFSDIVFNTTNQSNITIYSGLKNETESNGTTLIQVESNGSSKKVENKRISWSSYWINNKKESEKILYKRAYLAKTV